MSNSEDARTDAINKAFLIFVFIGAVLFWVWWKRPPAPPTIRVMAVNYQRSEFTAVTKDDMGKTVRIVAHCVAACPASLGTYAAGPESVYYFDSLRPDIISQSEER